MENARIAFESLKVQAEAEGHVVKVVGSLKPMSDEEMDIIGVQTEEANIVLVGMASSPELAKVEVVAASFAQQVGKPYGFFIDVRGVATGGRGWFSRELRDGASFICLTENEDHDAIQSFFPNATIVTTGHPKYEENGVIRIPPAEVLGRLLYHDVSRLKTRVFIPGSKTPAVNISVLRMLPDLDEVQFIMGVHPGHPKDEASMAVYKEFKGRVIFLTKETTGLGAVDLIPAMHIYANIASTDIGRAATLRLLCLQFETPEIVAMVTKNSGPDGFPPHDVKTGVATLMRSKWEVEGFLRSTDDKGQLATQEREYPEPPSVGTAVKKMLAVLTK
jgi:hypothetical protein